MIQTIKRGGTKPLPKDLHENQLGWDLNGKQLYIKDQHGVFPVSRFDSEQEKDTYYDKKFLYFEEQNKDSMEIELRKVNLKLTLEITKPKKVTNGRGFISTKIKPIKHEENLSPDKYVLRYINKYEENYFDPIFFMGGVSNFKNSDLFEEKNGIWEPKEIVFGEKQMYPCKHSVFLYFMDRYLSYKITSLIFPFIEGVENEILVQIQEHKYPMPM